MNIRQIKESSNKINFICIGACHNDNILKLKNEYMMFRTNPVTFNVKIGGVSSNIASNLSLMSKNVKIFSLILTREQKEYLKKNNVKYYDVANINNDNFYSAIINHKGKLIIGLASNEKYEIIKSLNYKKIDKHINKKTCLIIDLCFNKSLIKKTIRYYHKKNISIMVAGTSSFKIFRIRDSLKMISSICLNEDELFKLTNKHKIKESISYIIKKNHNINLVITRGNKSVIMIINRIKYSGSVPNIKIKNENGAGDAFAAMFFLCIKAKMDPKLILNLSITLGCLKAMDYKYKNFNEYENKFKHISNKIKVKKYYGKLY